jgi:hypothetical protein
MSRLGYALLGAVGLVALPFLVVAFVLHLARSVIVDAFKQATAD